MIEGITVIPAEGTQADDLIGLEDELRGIDGVASSGVSQARAIDPGGLLVWVSFVSEYLSAAGSAVSLISAIAGLLRKRGLGKARIVFPNGTTVEVESASTEQLSALIREARG